MLENALSLPISVQADNRPEYLINMASRGDLQAEVLEICSEKTLILRRILNEIYLNRLLSLLQGGQITPVNRRRPEDLPVCLFFGCFKRVIFLNQAVFSCADIDYESSILTNALLSEPDHEQVSYQ